MATMTNEQIEQKKQLLAEKVKEMKAICNELAEAGAIELSDVDLDEVIGGKKVPLGVTPPGYEKAMRDCDNLEKGRYWLL